MATQKKRSFFDRIAGASSIDDNVEFDDELVPTKEHGRTEVRSGSRQASVPSAFESSQDSSAGELPVDVHQTPNEIVIRAFVAGVRPDELNISISRDMVGIEGSRSERESISSADSFTRELFWGSFARTILLPQEVDVDNSSASAKDGLLTIILPKLDKARQTKLRVKSS
jgi:HSP20 family molecular chaperone IbpA